MSVLGRPQDEWDDFLEETRRPRKRWTLGRALWIGIPAAVVAAILVYHFAR